MCSYGFGCQLGPSIGATGLGNEMLIAENALMATDVGYEVRRLFTKTSAMNAGQLKCKLKGSPEIVFLITCGV